MTTDPNVSAVVRIGPPVGEDGSPPSEDASVSQQDIAKTKAHFTSAGFEVHAPLALSFSIGGKRSLFERVFGRPLKVDEETLGAGVTTESGELDLPLDVLPDEIRARVRSVAFIAPPPLVFSDS